LQVSDEGADLGLTSQRISPEFSSSELTCYTSLSRLNLHHHPILRTQRNQRLRLNSMTYF
jgi:hypothetical protein